VQLPIGNVVQQGGQFHDEQIGFLGLTDPLGRFPDTVNVPPVVAGAVAGQGGFDVINSAINEVG
jgi:hypothetical protein